MILVNFAHPLTDEHRATVERLAGEAVERVIDVKTAFDHEAPFGGQVTALVDRAGLSVRDWQTASLVVHLPGFSIIAALLLAELHGRMGYFPTVLRMRPVARSNPQRFEVAELVNVQAVRDQARVRRES